MTTRLRVANYEGMSSFSQKKRLTLLLLGLGLFSILAHLSYRALVQQRNEQAQMQPSTTGMQVSEKINLQGVDSADLALGDLRGQVVLINFWASWCGPCLSEMPGLYELQRKFGGRGFVVLGVNMDDNPQEGLKALKDKVGNAPFHTYKGLGTPIADRFRIEGLPFTVVLDRDQNIRYSKAGQVNWMDSEATSMIEGLL